MALEFTIEDRFDAPREAVFAGMTDLDGCSAWMQGFVRLEKLTQGEFGKGTTWRETRKMFGREATEEFQVTTFEPPGRLELHVDGTKGSSKRGAYRFVYELEPEGQGTHVVMRGEISGMGWFGELMGRLFIGSFKKACARDLTALKAHLARQRA